MTSLILPAFVPGALYAPPRTGHPDNTSVKAVRFARFPYLPVCGAPPLRFEKELPPPDLATEPPAAAPPIPALSPTEMLVAKANADAAQSTEDTKPPPAPPVLPKSNKPSILPDDLRPAYRAEDFLPFFRVPGSAPAGGDLNLIVPVPPTAPTGSAVAPSSALYRQTPR